MRGCPSSVADINMRFCLSVSSVLPISTHSSPGIGGTPANSSSAIVTLSPVTAAISTQ